MVTSKIGNEHQSKAFGVCRGQSVIICMHWEVISFNCTQADFKKYGVCNARVNLGKCDALLF